METSIIAVNVMNIANCVLELVSNSLQVNATSIAIRFHSEERKIQVIDNGIGISKVELKTIAEYNNKNYCNYPIRYAIHNWRKQTLTNIRRLSNIMMISSRYYNSSKTYMKIFKINHESKIERIERRPSQGTTITIYGFHELSLSKWNIAFMYYLIGNIAIANPQHFDFLPEKLHKLLRGNTKLIQTNILNAYDENLYLIKVKSGLQIPDILPHQEIDVRLCKNDRFCEFKINKKLLKFIKILGQLNNELIVGLIIQNNIKMLLLMDQHAIHERIRYEQLLHEYKLQIRNQLFSIKLKNPIVIQLSAKSCNLLLSNHKILKRFAN
ncbi:hypothetical protein HZU67_07734 [Apis mellifera carnica]|nr:hypothetical protein HZU67_07734 [Apis mellifera carnica]